MTKLIKQFFGRLKFAKECYEIRDGAKIIYLIGDNIITNSENWEKLIYKDRYKRKKLPRNSYCMYENLRSGVSIAIITIGNRLYIKPVFFKETMKEKLRELGIKPKEFETPFSGGAIPDDKDWVTSYVEEYSSSEKLKKAYQRLWKMEW